MGVVAHTCLHPALGRQRTEKSEKYKVSLCYKVSLRVTW